MEVDTDIRDGTVVSTLPGRLIVRLQKEQEDCNGCRACALKTLCHDRASGYIDVEVRATAAKEPGDAVRISYHSANPAWASIALFLPSLVGLCAGGFVAQALAGGGDGVFVAGALIGAAVGVAITFALGKFAKATAPEITLVE